MVASIQKERKGIHTMSEPGFEIQLDQLEPDVIEELKDLNVRFERRSDEVVGRHVFEGFELEGVIDEDSPSNP